MMVAEVQAMSDYERLERYNVVLPPTLHALAMRRAAEEGSNFSVVIRGFLARWIAGVVPSPWDLPTELITLQEVPELRDDAAVAKLEARIDRLEAALLAIAQGPVDPRVLRLVIDGVLESETDAGESEQGDRSP
jgi:hypothetical protein